MGYKYPSLRTTLPIAGYYARLDAGAAATDQFTVDGSQDGTLTNGATRTDDGGLAYSLDGSNDHIGLGNNFNSTIVGSSAKFTIAAWVKLTASGNVAIWSKLGDGTHTENNRQFSFSCNAGKLRCVWYGATDGSSIRVLEVTSASIVGAGWKHVAVTFDATISDPDAKVTLWINGASQTVSVVLSVGTPVSIPTSTARAAIGAAIGAASSVVSYPFADLIDDLLLFPVILSGTNIGYLAAQRGAIYAIAAAGGSLINGQSLIRPADSKPYQQLIGV